MRRLAGLAGALALVAGVAVLTPPAASAAPAVTAGACPGASGVTVVVDFQGLGPGTIVRCVPGRPSSGLDLLTQAGIAWQPVGTQGFVCKIEHQPTAESYARGCTTTPPTSAYWSYWVAPRGAAWCYSNVGAGGRTPIEGTVEGWSWSTGAKEGSTPPRTPTPPAVAGAPGSIDRAACPSPPATHPPATSPPATHPPATSPPRTTPPRATTPHPSVDDGSPASEPQAGDGGAPAPTQRGGRRTTTTTVAGATGDPADAAASSSSSSASSTASTTGSGDGSEQAAGTLRLDPRDDDTGSPLGALAAAGGVAALGAAAALAARRRRDAGPG